MKATPIALRNHMAQGSTTLAHLVKLTRKDGFVLSLVLDHDRPITFDGVTYQPAFGAMPSTVETSSALNVDNMDAHGALMTLGVQEKDIAAGLWDQADVRVLRVNWRDLSMRADKIKRGTFGELSVGRDSFNSEVRGITQLLQQVLGEVLSPSCKTDLFSARCGVVATDGVWKFSGLAVSAVVSRQQFATLHPSADGFFDAGFVEFQTGANAGQRKEIKTQITGNIWLQEPMPYEIGYGDLVTLYAGCLKRKGDCKDKFNNYRRFDGFPEVPGENQVLQGV